MARYNDAWMETLLSKNDIVSVVSSYVTLRAKGKKLWGLCPFHNEKTPSFSVSPDKQLYYCFGCKAGGSVVQFVMEMEHLPYNEAINFLAQRANLELPEAADDAELLREHARKERLYLACKAAAEFFHAQLTADTGTAARAYLANRGLTAGIVTRFGLGYAPNSWDALFKELTAQGFREDELLEAGLLVKNPNSGRVYDAYRNRVIFPIIGTNARVLGFGARTMGNETPKYINTGDTPIYSKRRNLYALNLMKGAKLADLVMVEGYMDVISLHAAGVTNAVASLGTSLTTDQARLLKRFVPTVYIAYDGDSAGQHATLRGLDILSAEGLRVRVIVFPDGLDPDDFVRKYKKEGFDSLRDQALALNAFKLMRMADEYDLSSEDGRQEYAMAGCRFISGLEPVERERYYAVLSRKTGFTVEALRAQSEQSAKSGFAQNEAFRPARRPRSVPEDTPRLRAEQKLLQAMLASVAAAGAVKDGDIALEALFADETHRALAQRILETYARGGKPDAALMMGGFSPDETQRFSAILDADAPAEPVKLAQDSIKSIRLCDTEAEIMRLREESMGDEVSLEEKLALTRRMQELDGMRRKLRLRQ